MSTLTLNTEPLAVEIGFDAEMFRVTLEDGRELAVPIEWFPRLRKASLSQRQNWRLIGRGEGIHWPDIDEDISVLGLLAGFGDTGRKVAAE
ncbi:MAG: DUF2442 domain-containing protein [Devosia sp.]